MQKFPASEHFEYSNLLKKKPEKILIIIMLDVRC